MDSTTLTVAIIGLILSAITIAAIFFGPIAAVKIQRRLDIEREDRMQDRNRKEQIFRTLWVTRSTPLNIRHVEALNLIELDYGDCSAVVAAWNLYLDHLNSDASRPGWEDHRVDLLTELLYEIALSLGRAYDRVLLKRHWYRPTLHGQIDEMDLALRTGFNAIMKGESSLPVSIVEKKT
jgi:Family of unknown function (DUF6680)